MKFNLKDTPLYLIYIAPTVHLAFGKQFGDLLNILSIVCLIYLFKIGLEDDLKNKKLFLFFSLIFFIYPLEIFVSQLLRWQWRVHDYMDQIRFIIAYPIFLYLINKRLDFFKYIEETIPLALIASYISTKYLFYDQQYDGRFANSFSDPLAYGQICLSMSLLLLATFVYSKERSYFFNIYKLIGMLLGVYISIETQSRTGWVAFPLIIIILLIANLKRLNIKLITITMLITVIFLCGLYNFSDIVHNRVNIAIYEIIEYPWGGGLAPDTSVGLRITFYRIGWFYITHNPWYGMGNKGFSYLMNAPELRTFASENAINFCYGALFHNELLTQTVRYGLLGIIGYLVVFIFPTYIFIKNCNNTNTLVRNGSLGGLIFMTTQIVAGISDEVLNLKYMILYFCLLLSISLTSVLHKSISTEY